LPWTPSAPDSQQYDRDGYFVRRQILSPDDVAAVRSAITQALAAPDEQRRGNYDEELVARHGSPLARERRYRKLGQFARHNDAVFNRGIAHPAVIEVMHHFLGPDLVLVYDSVFLKLARTGGATPWHQDIGLWPEKMHASFNFWIAIDAATRANGCLQFVPGSHKGPIVEHKLYDGGLHKELPRELCANLATHHVELAPGDAVFWHSNLWHYSALNTSEQDRIAIAGVYVTPACAANSPKAQGSMIWVSRDYRRAAWPSEKFRSDLAPTKSTY
jgi:ectoine hydroxylase-related dioxygenase (phytanoyl-CoA dioxygenase family)